MCFFGEETGSQLKHQKLFFRFFDKFHTQMIVNLFFLIILTQKNKKIEKKVCKFVFFGEETGSQLKLHKLFFRFLDKFHAQVNGNLFSDHFSSKIVRNSRKKFVNVFFQRGNWVPVKTPKTFFRFFDKFHTQVIGNLFSDHFNSKK